MKRIHYVYKITNLLNNKFYIGKHSFTQKNNQLIDQKYWGSSRSLKLDIKKFGIQNFKKQILQHFDTEDQAYQYEKQLVNLEFILSENTYNQTTGGKFTRDKQYTNNISDTMQKYVQYCNFYLKNHTFNTDMNDQKLKDIITTLDKHDIQIDCHYTTAVKHYKRIINQIKIKQLLYDSLQDNLKEYDDQRLFSKSQVLELFQLLTTIKYTQQSAPLYQTYAKQYQYMLKNNIKEWPAFYINQKYKDMVEKIYKVTGKHYTSLASALNIYEQVESINTDNIKNNQYTSIENMFLAYLKKNKIKTVIYTGKQIKQLLKKIADKNGLEYKIKISNLKQFIKDTVIYVNKKPTKAYKLINLPNGI